MKASFATSLAYRPPLIVLDEPFSGLDPLVRDELIEGLLERAPETTIFLSSHDLAEIECFSSHVGFLEQGNSSSEELSELTDRFRDVTVTLEGPSPLPARIPASWLQAQASDSVIRFVHSGYRQHDTERELAQAFPAARDVSFDPMPLRAIFLAIAKSSRNAPPAAAPAPNQGGSKHEADPAYFRQGHASSVAGNPYLPRAAGGAGADRWAAFPSGRQNAYGYTVSLSSRGGLGLLPYLLTFLIPLSWWILISPLIHEERLVGDRQFWITRPYEWTSLLAAKALFLFAYLYLPLFLAQIGVLAKVGFNPFAYLPGLLYDLFLITGLVILPLVALAAVTRNFGRMTLAILGAGVSILAIAGLTSVFPGTEIATPFLDSLSIFLVIGGCIAVILLQYKARRVASPGSSLGQPSGSWPHWRARPRTRRSWAGDIRLGRLPVWCSLPAMRPTAGPSFLSRAVPMTSSSTSRCASQGLHLDR